MKLELLYDEGRKVGYELIAETDQEREAMGFIRDAYFFGMDEDVMQYDGLKTGEHEKGEPLYKSIKSVSFKKKWAQDKAREERMERIRQKVKKSPPHNL